MASTRSRAPTRSFPSAPSAFTAYVPHNYPHEELEPGLEESAFYDPANFTFPGGCHITEVEIDPETGVVKVVDVAAADDIGTVINPMIVDGQVHGGLVQGIGQALYEEAVYDEDGQLKSGTYMNYTMPRAADFPMFKVGFHVTACTHNPLGSKGVGEVGSIGVPPSVINAVHRRAEARRRDGHQHARDLAEGLARDPASQGSPGGRVSDVTPQKERWNVQGLRVPPAHAPSRTRSRRSRAPTTASSWPAARASSPCMRLGLAEPSDVINIKGIEDLEGHQRTAATTSSSARSRRTPRWRASDVVSECASGPCGHGWAHRRPAGPQSRHARRLRRPRGPGSGLPGGTTRVEGHGRHGPPRDRGGRLLPGSLRDDPGGRRGHHEGEVPQGREGRLRKFASTASKYALVGVFVAKHGSDVRVAVTGASARYFRVAAMEQALAAQWSAEALDGITVPPDDLQSDMEADADYRAHLVGVMAKRAVRAAG